MAKKRRVTPVQMRKGIRKQLAYLRRNLRHIERLSKKTGLSLLTKRQYRDLLVITEVYRQQRQMYEQRKRRVDGRIVSISQPHVRPIVRGKAGTPVEFGAKFSISVIEGYTFIDRISWEAYHEASDLTESIERYRERYGYYPESVHVDQLYRNRDNRRYCKKRDIRISGPPLGRPPAETEELRKKRRQVRDDERARIAVEGKLGNGKRRYGLGRIMAKRADTSETTIGIIVLVMNLEKIMKDLLLRFFLSLRWVKKPSILVSNCIDIRGYPLPTAA